MILMVENGESLVDVEERGRFSQDIQTSLLKQHFNFALLYRIVTNASFTDDTVLPLIKNDSD